MHLQSLAWYAALVYVVALLFRQFFEQAWHAGLAAFVFAGSYTHAIPIFFLANRNTLISLFFGVLTLMWHDRGRRSGDVKAVVAAPIAFAIGLLAYEGSTAVCGYLVGYALFVDSGRALSRLRRVIPYFTVVIVWQALYHLLGYGAHGSAVYIDPIASPLAFISAVATRAPVYLLSQWFVPPADWTQLASPSILAVWRATAVGVILLLGFLMWPLLRRDRHARFWAFGMLVSIVPACATFPGDRMLMAAEIGGSALLVQWLTLVKRKVLFAPTARVRLVVARVVATILMAIHFVLSPTWLPIRIAATADAFTGITDGIEALAHDDKLDGKLVVLVDDVLFSGAYFGALRAISDRQPIEQFLVLSPADDRLDAIQFSRPSANTLVMRLAEDYDWFLERDRLHPFHPGDTVVIGHVTVAIQTVDAEGKPRTVAFTFDRPLDDPSIAWFGRAEPPLAFGLHGHYPPWTPPAIGRTIAAK